MAVLVTKNVGMLLLAIWIGGYRADIMKVHPPFHARFRSFFWIMQARRGTQDAMILVQDLPNGPCRTRQSHAGFTEAWILR